MISHPNAHPNALAIVNGRHREPSSQLVDAFGNPLISKRPKTSGYRPIQSYTWGHQVRDLPIFSFLTIDSMLVDQTVQLGMAMRRAPLAWVWYCGFQKYSGG